MYEHNSGNQEYKGQQKFNICDKSILEIDVWECSSYIADDELVIQELEKRMYGKPQNL